MSISAKVNNIDLIAGGGTINDWAKAGVMVRDTLDAGSVHGFVSATPTPAHGVSQQWRPVADAGSSNIDVADVTIPVWVRLERDISGMISGYYSDDGVGWTPVGGPNTAPVSVPMYVGLAVTSHNVDQTVSVTFSDVKINDAAPTSSFTNQDIGITHNMAEDLYVELSDGVNVKRVNHPDDPDAILSDVYQQWDIALSEFSPVNPANVQQISVGVGTPGAVSGTAEGQIFVDNIFLHRPRYVAGKLPARAADIVDDDDGQVNFRDAEAMFGEWLIDVGPVVSDQNADDKVNFEDFALFLDEFGIVAVWPAD